MDFTKEQIENAARVAGVDCEVGEYSWWSGRNFYIGFNEFGEIVFNPQFEDAHAYYLAHKLGMVVDFRRGVVSLEDKEYYVGSVGDGQDYRDIILLLASEVF